MKIAIAPDLHLNKAVYKGVKDRDNPALPFRSADFMRAFEYIVDICINELKPDLFVIPGDVYDHPSPSNKVRGFFSTQLKKLTDAKIPSIILLGNHDVFMKDHALKDIKELDLKSIKIIESPTIFSYKGLKLLFLPYSTDVEQKKVTMREEFNNFLKEIKEKDNGTPSLFFGHFAVQGAKMNEYIDPLFVTDTTTTDIPLKAKKDFINKNPNDIKVSDLDKIGAEYVFLGDFHEFQIMNTKKCVALYGGSIEKSDLSEINQKKGFILFDTEAEEKGNMGKCRFIEYPNCRPMLQLEGNFDDIRKQFAKQDVSKLQDSIVKIAFKGTGDELLSFSSGLDAFKKELRDKLNPIHVVTTQKVKNEAIEEEASQLEQEIMEKGHLEAEDIMPIVKEALKEKSKDKDKEELEAIVDLAQEIYDEVTKG